MKLLLKTEHLRKIFYLSVSLWSIAIVINILTIFNIDVADSFPFVWILHLGIFAIILPIILSQAGSKNDKATRQKFNLIAVFKGAPIWIPILAIGGIVCAIIGLIFFMESSIDGTVAFDTETGYYLHNRGKFIKNITEEQYHIYNAEILQGFSTVWIWFYGFGMAMLHKINRDRKG